MGSTCGIHVEEGVQEGLVAEKVETAEAGHLHPPGLLLQGSPISIRVRRRSVAQWHHSQDERQD